MKKILSVVLAIIMVTSVIFVMPVNAVNTKKHNVGSYNVNTVVSYANSKVGTSYANGYCLAFVKQIFADTCGFTSTACCAYKYGNSFIDSTSKNNIPVGADVFFGGSNVICSCGSRAGHIGIYVGDGMVIHAWSGKIVKTSLDYIINCGYPYRGWGWHGNQSFYTPPIGNNPEGCFDWVKSNSPGTIQVHGWAFDRDDLGASLAIHVYVGGLAGSGAPGYPITANKSRPDVNNHYPGVGNNHGFDDKISVSKTGLQTIYVYAINVGGGTGHTLLGYQNVFVKTDAEKPTISNITVSQVNSKGYRISCKVSDNLGVAQVKFPTWTLKTDSKGNDQDDLVWHVGSIDGSIATYYVKTSDHNNETGGYVTDIYAYDNAGNSNMTRASISVTNEPKMISSTKYNGNTYKVFNSGMTWIQAKEWCEKQGGHLATISNSSEWNAVKQALEKYNGVPCWLGAESTSGTWKWVTGENLTYTNWSSGQPDCAGKNEFYLGTFNDSKKWLDCYLWNDYPCDGAGLIGGFVCEFEKTTLTLSRYSGSIYVKGTAIFRPTVKNGKGVTTYKSNNTRVAKVDSGGKLTALKAGTAKITITNNKVSKVFTVKVLNPKLNKTSVSISRGKSYTLKITGKIGTAKFYTSNKKIATVNSKGKIKVNKKAKKGKTVIIKVKTNGITLKCKVKVK